MYEGRRKIVATMLGCDVEYMRGRRSLLGGGHMRGVEAGMWVDTIVQRWRAMSNGLAWM